VRVGDLRKTLAARREIRFQFQNRIIDRPDESLQTAGQWFGQLRRGLPAVDRERQSEFRPVVFGNDQQNVGTLYGAGICDSE
jgi:hypothetical protein